MIKMKKLSATTFAMALSLGGLALAGGCEKNDGQKQETTPSNSPPAVTPAVQTQPADKPAPNPAAQVPADKPADPAAAQGNKPAGADPAVEQKEEPGEEDGCGGCGAPPPKQNPAPDTVTTEKKPAPHGCGKKGCG